MGKEWDSTGVAFDPATWAEVFRVLKPGAHLLAFGGTRTYHRMACAIEDAGFEIRDSLHWIYGSGFPKSMDVSKAIDKAAGAERRVIGTKVGQPGYSLAENRAGGRQAFGEWTDAESECAVTAPATENAERWQGWGTALKPAHEPIVVARKPLAGKTVAANVVEFGTGGLNIDASRVMTADSLNGGAYAQNGNARHDGTENWRYSRLGDAGEFEQPSGRWPPNILLTHSLECEPAGTWRIKDSSRTDRTDRTNGISSSVLKGGADGSLNQVQSPGYADESGMETVQAWDCVQGCPVREMDVQSPHAGAAAPVRGTEASRAVEDEGIYSGRERVKGAFHDDTGGASRFFPCFRYQAKAPQKERPKVDGIAHPTCKPLELMRWLVKLVTPPGGMVLDPFAGSGTTGEACRSEGFGYTLIEREADYIRLISKRMQQEPSLFDDWGDE